MSIHIGDISGPFVGQYTHPEDGLDAVNADSVNVPMSGIEDDLAFTYDRALIAGRNNLRGYAFAISTGAGILSRAYVDGSGGVLDFTALAMVGYDYYQFSFFDGGTGNLRSFNERFASAQAGRTIRVLIRAHASNSDNLTIHNGLSTGGSEVICVLTPFTTAMVWVDFLWIPESGGSVLSVVGHSAGVLCGPSAYGTV